MSSGELRFDGRVVVVTGAGRGLGREHALLFGRRGACVVVNDLGGSTRGEGSSAEPAESVVAEIVAAGGSAVADTSSVADPDGATTVVAHALDEFGRIDAVVNNAGIAIPGPFESLTQDQFAYLARVHYEGTVRVCRAAWPHLAASGHGRIVNTVSSAILGLPNWAPYGAAKGAILGFSLNLATEAPAHGIAVNCLAPGAVTRMLLDSADMVPEGAVERMSATLPPELVAPAAVFLAHESCPLNGEILSAAGGSVRRVFFAITEGFSDAQLIPESIRDRLDEVLDVDGAGPWLVQG